MLAVPLLAESLLWLLVPPALLPEPLLELAAALLAEFLFFVILLSVALLTLAFLALRFHVLSPQVATTNGVPTHPRRKGDGFDRPSVSSPF